MIGILLAALGVPLWLIVGMLTGALLSRRAFKNAPGVFRAKLRVTSGAARGLKADWARMPAYAAWVHDVLIVHEGIALVRSRALPVVGAADFTVLRQEKMKGLGDDPLVLTLILDNDAMIELAAPKAARETMFGPFKKHTLLTSNSQWHPSPGRAGGLGESCGLRDGVGIPQNSQRRCAGRTNQAAVLVFLANSSR
jgi:hypothetical protein